MDLLNNFIYYEHKIILTFSIKNQVTWKANLKFLMKEQLKNNPKNLSSNSKLLRSSSSVITFKRRYLKTGHFIHSVSGLVKVKQFCMWLLAISKYFMYRASTNSKYAITQLLYLLCKQIIYNGFTFSLQLVQKENSCTI